MANRADPSYQGIEDELLPCCLSRGSELCGRSRVDICRSPRILVHYRKQGRFSGSVYDLQDIPSSRDQGPFEYDAFWFEDQLYQHSNLSLILWIFGHGREK